MSITFVTTTSHGTWLPGDMRGYVSKGLILPGDAKLLEISKQQLKSAPVYFSCDERARLLTAITAACTEFCYRLSDLAIERSHLHWIMFHGNDPIETAIGRLKTRMRQALARGKNWTEGYCAEPLYDEIAIEQTQKYIARHDGCVMSNGQLVDRGNPRQSRGLTAVK